MGGTVSLFLLLIAKVHSIASIDPLSHLGAISLSHSLFSFFQWQELARTQHLVNGYLVDNVCCGVLSSCSSSFNCAQSGIHLDPIVEFILIPCVWQHRKASGRQCRTPVLDLSSLLTVGGWFPVGASIGSIGGMRVGSVNA